MASSSKGDQGADDEADVENFDLSSGEKNDDASSGEEEEMAKVPTKKTTFKVFETTGPCVVYRRTERKLIEQFQGDSHRYDDDVDA